MNLLTDEEKALVQFAIEYLETRDYVVSFREGFRFLMTPQELHAKLPGHVKYATMHQRLHHKDCPAFEAELGETGRIVKLRANGALLQWLSREVHEKKRKVTG